MDNIKEKIAYLQGLTEGLDVRKGTREGRILGGIVDVLEDIALNINELEEYVETIDEDLSDLEEDVYEDYDSAEVEEYDELEDAEEYIRVECPNCHEMVYFDADILDDEDVIEVTCPNCDDVVFVNDEEEIVGYVDEEYLPEYGGSSDDI